MTLAQIARQTGLSRATVSYALRNSPLIAEETRRRVRAAAAALGYRPNPRVAELLAQIRRGRKHPSGDRIAFVWVHTSRAEAQSAFLQRVRRGARERAAQLGYSLEEFWTVDVGRAERRLQEIILARGITGVVFSPVVTAETKLTLDWDWSRVAAAVIGNVPWTPELHHAGHHHFAGMQTCLAELERLGCRRPAALIDAASNERAKRAWEGAFLAHHPLGAGAAALWTTVPSPALDTLPRRLRRHRADALIVSTTDVVPARRLRELAALLPRPLVVSLHVEDDTPAMAGLDSMFDRIAAHAVDLVTAQLASNELGPPDRPRLMLLPGVWVPRPTLLRPASSSAGGVPSPRGIADAGRDRHPLRRQ